MKFINFAVICPQMPKFHKKAVLGLSMEFLVTVIISLVILAGGVALLYTFIEGGKKAQEDLDQRTQEELERLLVDEGKQVALPLHTAEISAGESHLFGIGILNIGGLETEEFMIKVEPLKLINQNNQAEDISGDQSVKDWLLYNNEILKIKENEHFSEKIFVEVPKTAKKGQYIFEAKVFSIGTGGTELQYGNTQNFYVTVK